MSWLDELTFDDRGLLPVIAQEASTGEVLMLAHANREALELTARSGQAHYWSRSRGTIWRKGETSGHTQQVVEIRADCDGDALLYRIRQRGPACHTLAESCFHRLVVEEQLEHDPAPGHILHEIARTVAERAHTRPEGSYTTYLFNEGLDKILKKIGEEATEVVIAAKNGDGAEIRSETADLLYHLLVMLQEREVPLEAIWSELGARFGRAPRPRRDAARSAP